MFGGKGDFLDELACLLVLDVIVDYRVDWSVRNRRMGGAAVAVAGVLVVVSVVVLCGMGWGGRTTMGKRIK
jgi:hypothetical protein